MAPVRVASALLLAATALTAGPRADFARLHGLEADARHLHQHPPAAQAGPHLARLRAGLEGLAEIAEPTAAWDYIQAHAAQVIDGSNCPPAGICAPVRGALVGARAISSYDHAVRLIRETYRTILAEPGAFLGAPEVAFPRVLGLSRQLAGEQIPVDLWLTRMHMVESLGTCEDLHPHAYDGVALMAARDASVHPSYAEGVAILDRAVTYLGAMDVPARARFHTAALALGAGLGDEARFWTRLQFADQLVRLEGADARDRAVLAPAVDRAWGMDHAPGAALLGRAFAELLAEAAPQ